MTSSLLPPVLAKLLTPVAAVRRAGDRSLNTLASTWVAINNACWYLVSSNHQSWVDILVLQRVFHGHIPFLKFFLKRDG